MIEKGVFSEGKKTVGFIEVTRQQFGGVIYNTMAQNALSKDFDVKTINVGAENFTKLLYPKILYKLCRIKGQMDIWIRPFDAVVTMPLDHTVGADIALIHHIDNSIQPRPARVASIIMEKIFYANLTKLNAIVTVSNYWRDHFLERGYPHVSVIFNGFDVDGFSFTSEEIQDFRRRFNIVDKPIIYLGNCQRAKGVVEAYQQLKDLDAYIITSGREEIRMPALNLNLDYRDYLRLLKASAVVVTMSKFREGWCRTAHEAMLCETPVVGSGLGGMRELLEGGKQTICSDFSELKERVEYLIKHPEVGQRGYEFARQFTLTRFEEEWLAFIKKLL